MFRWVDTWVPCYVFHPSFLTMWGAKCVHSFLLPQLILCNLLLLTARACHDAAAIMAD